MARQLWKFEPTARWIRAQINDQFVVDSRNAMLMIESPGELDYFFPRADIQAGILTESDHTERSGYRGVKRFWHAQVGDQHVENAFWSYDAKDNRPNFDGYLALSWSAAEHWYEEAEEVFHHARNPYHRVDTIKSSRHVQVLVDGVQVAETNEPWLLFETSLPVRYYMLESAVDSQFLTDSNLSTKCPYKGTASYYHLNVNGELYENSVWYYPDPIPEAPTLKKLVCFWPEKDKRIKIVVDGETQ